MELNDDFGHWLAGYADGEGTFNCALYVPKGRNATQIVPMFSIGARSDEYPILAECRERTGIGSLYFVRQRTNNPRWHWTVNTKAGCQQLVAIFERYPLRAKKAKDFEVWAQIVREHAGHKRGQPIDKLRELVHTLRSARVYDNSFEPQEVTSP